MQLQAYKGYFQQGNFYSDGRAIAIPEMQYITITILDEPASHMEEIILARGREALREAQEQAVINGTSEMTLEEINEIIKEVRQGASG